MQVLSFVYTKYKYTIQYHQIFNPVETLLGHDSKSPVLKYTGQVFKNFTSRKGGKE
jgi:hypothetical protein